MIKLVDLTKHPPYTRPVAKNFPSDNPVFHDEHAARAAMEALRWPDGPVCPHCQENGRSFQIGGPKQSHRPGLRHCKSCRKQFTVSVGTVLARTRVSYVNWMRLAYLLSRTDVGDLKVPEVTEALAVPYKTAVRMLDRVCYALITYKGMLSGRKFGKPITYYIVAKARPPQPRLRHPQHPSNLRDKANVGRRYRSWKQRLELDPSFTPEPRGVLVALSGLDAPSKKDLARIERLLMVLLKADLRKVKAARKLSSDWDFYRSRLYDARVRLPNRKPSTASRRDPGPEDFLS
jgi:transposase-like protein